MSFLYEQLPLAFQRQDSLTLDNFIDGDNQSLLHGIRQLMAGDERYLYLYGARGSGRSHLLQAACHLAEQQGLSSVYLPLAELSSYDPNALFDGLETLQLVCFDDIHAVVGNRLWDTALFSVYNALADQGTRLLVSADRAVRELDVTLEDLRSRLSWGAVFQLQALAEDQQREVIRRRARSRGLELGDEVLQFIFHRCQRDMDSLLDVLEKLDRASLQEQRRLTIPFVKSTLNW